MYKATNKNHHRPAVQRMERLMMENGWLEVNLRHFASLIGLPNNVSGRELKAKITGFAAQKRWSYCLKTGSCIFYGHKI